MKREEFEKLWNRPFWKGAEKTVILKHGSGIYADEYKYVNSTGINFYRHHKICGFTQLPNVARIEIRIN